MSNVMPRLSGRKPRPRRLRLAVVLMAGAVCAAASSCAPGPPHGLGGPGAGAPPVTILTRSADAGGGDIFIAPRAPRCSRTAAR